MSPCGTGEHRAMGEMGERYEASVTCAIVRFLVAPFPRVSLFPLVAPVALCLLMPVTSRFDPLSGIL